MTINEIKALEYVDSANEWKDRIYIDLKGNGGNYRGEKTAKIYIKDGALNVELGKGMTSSEWDQNLKSLRAALAA